MNRTKQTAWVSGLVVNTQATTLSNSVTSQAAAIVDGLLEEEPEPLGKLVAAKNRCNSSTATIYAYIQLHFGLFDASCLPS